MHLIQYLTRILFLPVSVDLLVVFLFVLLFTFGPVWSVLASVIPFLSAFDSFTISGIFHLGLVVVRNS